MDTRLHSWLPTEVLAEQHFAGIRALLEGMTVTAADSLFAERPLRVELLTNRVGTAADRQAASSTISSSGNVDIAIGTHALIQEGGHLLRVSVLP